MPRPASIYGLSSASASLTSPTRASSAAFCKGLFGISLEGEAIGGLLCVARDSGGDHVARTALGDTNLHQEACSVGWTQTVL